MPTYNGIACLHKESQAFEIKTQSEVVQAAMIIAGALIVLRLLR